MARPCTVCQHPDRDAVDAALIVGEPVRTIAGRFGLSHNAVLRHRDGHLPEAMAKAREAGEVARGDELLAQVQDLQARTLAILNGAEKAKDGHLALRAIREARGNLELLGRLAGELQTGVTVNVLGSGEWVRVRGLILAALEAHPVARLAVAEVLALGAGDAGA